jgi:hypothetical protein
VSGTMAALGVAQSAASYSSGVKGAKAQASYSRQLSIYNNRRYSDLVEYQKQLANWQEDYYQKNAALAQNNANSQYGAVLEAVNQARNQTMARATQFSKSTAQARSMASVSALESGTTGNSILLAQQLYEQAEAQETQALFDNLDAQVRQSQRDLLAIQAQGQGQINQAMPQPMAPIDPVQPMQQIQAPSSLPYLIQAGSSVIGAYAYHQQMQGYALKTQSIRDATSYGPPIPQGFQFRGGS